MLTTLGPGLLALLVFPIALVLSLRCDYSDANEAPEKFGGSKSEGTDDKPILPSLDEWRRRNAQGSVQYETEELSYDIVPYDPETYPHKFIEQGPLFTETMFSMVKAKIFLHDIVEGLEYVVKSDEEGKSGPFKSPNIIRNDEIGMWSAVKRIDQVITGPLAELRYCTPAELVRDIPTTKEIISRSSAESEQAVNKIMLAHVCYLMDVILRYEKYWDDHCGVHEKAKIREERSSQRWGYGLFFLFVAIFMPGGLYILGAILVVIFSILFGLLGG